MGQAVADLPDPLETASPAEAQSADDLLSQLAGDEIDRLLAESEGAAPAPKPAAVAAETPAPVAAVPATPPAPLPAQSVDLDAVLATAAVDRKVSPTEKSALQTASPAPEVPAPVDTSPQIDLGDSIHRVPLFLRPLEWLSSPLDPWPDQVREIIGKVGLLTLVNALAVLTYVLLVRKHH